MAQLLAVALGGAVGALGRFAVGRWAAEAVAGSFPYGTLIVNAVGSVVLGILVGVTASHAKLPAFVLPLVGTGFCGAFTTYSTYAVETVTAGRTTAVLNVLANNLFALVAAAVGVYVGVRVGSAMVDSG